MFAVKDCAFVFPGQGSQALGMGQEIASKFSESRHVFEEVDEALGYKLSDIMWNDEVKLNLTENAQPALLASSVAVMQALISEGFDPVASLGVIAGHSLGEYTALVVAGTISLSDAARLLHLRGQMMQKVVSVGVGGMAAILGLDLDKIIEIVEKINVGEEICDIANDNAPGQIVISGLKTTVSKASELSKTYGAKRVVELSVSVPSHSRLMKKAADLMEDSILACHMDKPSIPVVFNVTAETMADVDIIKSHLLNQMFSVVRWRESVLWMAKNNIKKIVEVGTGKVLTGLTKRIDRTLLTQNISNSEDVFVFMEGCSR